jgi:hypothetical protein
MFRTIKVEVNLDRVIGLGLQLVAMALSMASTVWFVVTFDWRAWVLAGVAMAAQFIGYRLAGESIG